MGSSSGPLWSRVTYKLPHPQQQQQQPGVLQVTHTANNPLRQQQQQQEHQQVCDTQQLSVWDYLQSQLQALRLSPSVSAAAAEQLPFNFWGGFVGYLGYELKAECGGANAHPAPGPDAAWQFADRVIVADHSHGDVYLLTLHDTAAAATGTAREWLQATAATVQELAASAAAAVAGSADRQRQQQGMLGGSTLGMPVFAAAAVQEAPTCAAAAAAGVNQNHSSIVQQQMYTAAAAAGGCRSASPQQAAHDRDARLHVPSKQQQQQLPAGVSLRHDRSSYLSNIASCKEALVAGEGYELCLTTAFEVEAPPDPWTYYTTLRAHNPAPYAAWLNFGASSSSSSSTASPPVVVCCSSPERFLQGGRGGLLEAKPIKGTAARSSDPAADAAAAAGLLVSEKERAENLMIVDLLRNDLGKVCVRGSVHVPGLLQLESYASVHQLVSTVRGLRAEGVGPVEAIRAAFPGGSMTGSPKIRSMAILDDLEGSARGVYSGALGYLSVNDTFDLNIVIRSAVFVGDQAGVGTSSSDAGGEGAGGGLRMSVGAGGAIVVQSDPPAEFAEMQLKAERLLQTAVLAQQKQ
jgi:para-aminobenzoate synthetase